MNILTLNGTVENSSALPKFEVLYPQRIDPLSVILKDEFQSNFGALAGRPIEKSPAPQNWENMGGTAWTVFAEGYASANAAGNNRRVVNHKSSGKIYLCFEFGVAMGYCSIIFRALDAANHMEVRLSSTNGNIYLYKAKTGSTTTNVVIGTVPLVIGKLYEMGLTYDETGFKVYIDGVEVANVLDVDLSTNTKVGIESGGPLQKIWEFAAN